MAKRSIFARLDTVCSSQTSYGVNIYIQNFVTIICAMPRSFFETLKLAQSEVTELN